ncbi:MAG: ABC transporter ATPase [Polaribacter sp.]|uniref:ABC transporter ATPase n=1 Tax=Polaribacter sp. TaxID=1920175 RepID=UPI000A623295|nr:ABC transporter ATPase [Polaribacter sp.]|tara:strand:+ start:1427 stop:1912 length:486 start_codon:yes stop_codon:yes gene_type:complete
MFVNFDEIPEDAKVWVYPSSRKFYTDEIPEISEKIKTFVTEWKADDESFKASYQFLYNRFIVITADDITTPLKNSDIDDSVNFILSLQETYEVALLDRMNICFKQGEFVQYKDLKDFKKLLKNKALTGKSIIFDNLITTKQDFDNLWEIPIEESWYNRFLR